MTWSRLAAVLATACYLLPVAAGAEAPASRPPIEALVEGERLLARGDAAAAVPALVEAAAASWPARDLAWLLLARAKLAAGDPKAALEAAGKVAGAVEGSVRVAAAAWLQAEALAAAGHWPDAARAFRQYRQAHADTPNAGLARLREAEALEHAGDAAAAARAWRDLWLEAPATAPDDAFERALRLAGRAGTALAPPSAADLLRRAEALSTARLHERAEAAFAAALVAPGGDGVADSALHGRARSLFFLRRNDETRSTCAELRRRFPRSERNTPCLLLSARAAWRVGDDDAVLAATEEALTSRLHRGSRWRADLLHVRANFLLLRDAHDQAVETFDRLLAEHPDATVAADARWRAAWARFVQGRHDDAARRFAAVVASRPEPGVLAGARYWQAMALDREGRAEEATAVLSETFVRWPWSFHGEAARAELATRVDARTLESLAARAAASGTAPALPPPPRLTGAHAERYELLGEAGLWAHALPELEALAAASPRSPSLGLLLAEARARAGQGAAGYRLLASRFAGAITQPSRQAPVRFWRVVYPSAHDAAIERAAAAAGVDPSLVRGIIRQESWWDPAARSTADARGLMQLLPSTATRVARDAGLTDFDPERLFEPDLNVFLGARYLGDLLRRFGGDEAAAVAAYNAGEARVEEWWRGFEAAGVKGRAERVERIPFRETRPYVKAVLEAASWYRWLAAPDTPPGS